MSEVFIYKTKSQQLKPEQFTKIARNLGIRKKLVQTDEALAVHDSDCALVYGQPGSKFGGVLFFTDQSKSMGEMTEKLPDSKKVKRWADEFLNEFKLIPEKSKDRTIRFNLSTMGTQTHAITFDGKERKKKKIKTEIKSKITLNDVAVVGPRAKVRMVFNDPKRPLMIHCGLWKHIEVFEKRELVREHDIIKVIKEKLARREERKVCYDVVDIKLAYFAREFEGGPDLLAPYYFIEIEFEDEKGRESGISQGPKQIFWLPAYR